MAMLQDNGELLDGYRRGDRDALERIYSEYIDDVEAIVRQGFTTSSPDRHYVPGVSGEQACKDVIQDCFVRAFSESARKNYDGERPFRPYLLRIVKNRMIDRARKTDRMVLADDAEDEGDTLDLNAIIEKNRAVEFRNRKDPEERLHWKKLTDAVDGFLESVDDEQRRFVELRYRNELSQRKVAEQMDVSRRRVRTLQKWVRRGLKGYLREQQLLSEGSING